MYVLYIGGGGGGSSYFGSLTGYTGSESGQSTGCNGMRSCVYNPSAACGAAGQDGYVVIALTQTTCTPTSSPSITMTPSSPTSSPSITFLPSSPTFKPTNGPTWNQIIAPSTQPTFRPVPSRQPSSISRPFTFSFTGSNSAFAVPNGVFRIYVYLWGAGGGFGAPGRIPGMGAYVEGALSVTPGQTLSIIVGGRGVRDGGAPSSFGGGGRACCSNSYWGGGGGGRSAIQLNGQDIVTAGGGGGSANNCGGSASSYFNNSISNVAYGGYCSSQMRNTCNGNNGGGGSSTTGWF